MATQAPAGLTVIPAYRVVAHFVREVQGLPRDAALDTLEGKVRQYVRHLLSGMQASYADVGERSAVTQLGDPDLEVLAAALRRAEAAAPKRVVEEALRRSAEVLPRPDLAARVLLLPGDGESRALVRLMQGVMGMSLGDQATLLFFWPVGQWTQWLAYTAAHEYAHLVRNHYFPRGFAGGRPVYLKTQEPETLLDAMVAEGIADAFARHLFPHLEPPWLRALSPEEEAAVWPRVRRRLGVGDPAEVRRFVYGDGDRVPQWTGSAIGYRAVRRYLERHPGVRPAALVGLQARAIFAGSGYGEGAGPPP